jgi:hypothetical protein
MLIELYEKMNQPEKVAHYRSLLPEEQCGK